MNGLPRLTIAAAVAVLLTSLSLMPTMADLTWLRATVMCIVAVSLTGYLGRRFRVPALLIPLLQLAVLVLVLTLRFAQDLALWHVLPGSAVVDQTRLLLNEATDTISSYAPPAPVTPGLVFLIAMSVGLVMIVVDMTAVTYRSPAIAGLPLLVLYAVPVAVVANGVSWVYFGIAAVGWLALLLADGRERLGGWGRRLGTRTFAGDPTATDVRSAPEPLGAVGRRIGAVSLALAVIVPAVLPGLSESLFGGGNGLGSGSGKNTVKTVNPFVSIGAALNRPEDTEVLHYTSSASTPDYLRLVSLDSFDGTNWVPANLESSSRISNDDALPGVLGLSGGTPRTPVTTDVTLTGLSGSTWLPAPYPPTALTMDANRARDWVWDISNRVAWSPKSNSDNLRYTVESLAIQPTRNQLVFPEATDIRIVAPFQSLPDSVPDSVRQLARQVTTGTTSQFAAALALQNYFRDPDNFTYDPAATFSTRDPMVDFLRSKRGFCQQFAGTFAVMARSLGLATRVVVGFVPGDRQPDGTWVVTWHDTHAWPEVYFQGVGWVRFEPTPRNDNAGVAVPNYTLASAQVEGPEGQEPATPGGGTSESPSASQSGGELPFGADQRDRDRGVSEFDQIQKPFPWVWVITPILVLVVALLPWALRLDQRRRRLVLARGPDPRDAAAAAWTELAATCADLDRAWPSSRTPRQVAADLVRAAHLEHDHPSSADALRRLALATERGRYARSPELVEGLATDVTTAREGLLQAATRWQRLRARFAPVSLLSRAAARTADALDWVDAAPRRARRLARRPQSSRTGAHH